MFIHDISFDKMYTRWNNEKISRESTICSRTVDNIDINLVLIKHSRLLKWHI